jgi:hypothetical protein
MTWVIPKKDLDKTLEGLEKDTMLFVVPCDDPHCLVVLRRWLKRARRDGYVAPATLNRVEGALPELAKWCKSQGINYKSSNKDTPA